MVPSLFGRSVLDNSPFIRNLPALSAPRGPYKATSVHRLPIGRDTRWPNHPTEGQNMNEFLSAAADFLTVVSASLAIAVEVRRARREADRAGRGDDPRKE